MDSNQKKEQMRRDRSRTGFGSFGAYLFVYSTEISICYVLSPDKGNGDSVVNKLAESPAYSEFIF